MGTGVTTIFSSEVFTDPTVGTDDVFAANRTPNAVSPEISTI